MRLSSLDKDTPMLTCESVWQFDVNITNGHINHMLVVQTDVRWTEFFERVLAHLNQPHNEICLGYRIRGDAHGPSYLMCEADWDSVLWRIQERIMSVRKQAVTIEIKDMVSTTAPHDKDVLSLTC